MKQVADEYLIQHNIRPSAMQIQLCRQQIKIIVHTRNFISVVTLKSKQYVATYNYIIDRYQREEGRQFSSHIYNPISSPSLIRQRPEKSDKSSACLNCQRLLLLLQCRSKVARSRKEYQEAMEKVLNLLMCIQSLWQWCIGDSLLVVHTTMANDATNHPHSCTIGCISILKLSFRFQN